MRTPVGPANTGPLPVNERTIRVRGDCDPTTREGATRRAILLPVSGEPVVYFEDIQLGEQYTSPGRTVTEADLVIFAGLSGDYNVLHTDAEHMKASLFGERIAHGLLGLSIQQGLLDRVVPGQAVGPLAAVKWKFKGPIKIGDTIHVEARVSAKKDGEQPRVGLITLERRVVNQRGEVVQEGETDHLVGRRPA